MVAVAALAGRSAEDRDQEPSRGLASRGLVAIGCGGAAGAESLEIGSGVSRT